MDLKRVLHVLKNVNAEWWDNPKEKIEDVTARGKVGEERGGGGGGERERERGGGGRGRRAGREVCWDGSAQTILRAATLR